MSALIIVDLQNDFMPGGALSAHEGDQVIPIIDRIIKLPFDVKIATKDWHPKEHVSFADNHQKQPGSNILLEGYSQTLWPMHCVQGSFGAEFVKGWDISLIQFVILKGTDPQIDSYSTFFDNRHLKATPLERILKDNNVESLFFAGLATDYCIKFSVLDAIQLGFKKVHVILDACRGVNVLPQDSQQAIDEMKKAGAIIMTSQELFSN